jgi:hypothetical protein
MNPKVKAILKRRHYGLATELFWFMVTILVIGFLYVVCQPIFQAMVDFSILSGVSSNTINLWILIWNNYPALVMFVGVIFVIAAAIFRQAMVERQGGLY